MISNTYRVGFKEYWSESAAKAKAKEMGLSYIYFETEKDGEDISFGKIGVNETIPALNNGFEKIF